MKKRSLLLNDKWDIYLAPSGNIETTTAKYCDAQNIANAVRLFTRDAYLAQQKGVPHFSIDLGIMPLTSVVRARFRGASLNVENIAEAEVTITDMTEDRVLEGYIEAVNAQGETLSVAM